MPTLDPRSAALSRAEIVQAAMEVVESGGLEVMTIRSLATRLRVSPMALYRHVSSKDDLLLSVIDALFVANAPSESEASTWRDHLTNLALSLRTIVRDRPSILAVFSRQAVTTPAAQQRFADAIHLLERAGFADDEARRLYAAVHTYTLGFCLLESGRGRWGAKANATAGSDLVRAIQQFVTEEQFVYGLRALLGGLAQGSAPQN